MKNLFLRTTAMALVTTVGAVGSVSAQSASEGQFYGGLGIASEQFAISDGFDALSDSSSNTSVLLGYKYATESDFFFAGEFDYTFHSSTFLDTTARVRGLAGMQFGDVEAFISFGASRQNTSGGPQGVDGRNYGIGAQYPVSENIDIRLEYIRDEYENFDGKYTNVWSVDSIRAAAIFNF